MQIPPHLRKRTLLASSVGLALLATASLANAQAQTTWPDAESTKDIEWAAISQSGNGSGEYELTFKESPAAGTFSLPTPAPHITSIYWKNGEPGSADIGWKFNSDATSLDLILKSEAPAGAKTLVLETAETSKQFIGGRITFSALDSEVTGEKAKLETHAGNHRIGFWTRAEDVVSWNYKPTRWGMYDIELTYSAAGGAAEVYAELNGQRFTISRPATGSWYDYRTIKVGRIYLEDQNPFELKVSCSKLESGAVMNLKAITLRPAPEGDPIKQNCQTGAVSLHSKQAITRSVLMRYEPKDIKNCLGYWANPADWAEWRFEVDEPGAFYLDVFQGCGTGHGGSEVAVEVAGQRYTFEVLDTGHFQNFVQRRLGEIFLPAAGSYTLEIRPIKKAGGAVMDIREIRLEPSQDMAPTGHLLEKVLDAKRVLFLGDSITYSGGYVVMLETALRQAFPKTAFEFINIGLPSETVSGLSEPNHAGGSFPRPELRERMERAFTLVKPDLVFACYGMNDGIYYPHSQERMDAFQNGILELRERAAQDNVPVVHLTPPVFDSYPLRGRTLPAGLEEYTRPYEGYDDVLFLYGEWLLSQKKEGWSVIDIHGPMKKVINRNRETNPDFILAGDGVHANEQGHWIMAREVIKALELNVPGIDEETPAAWLASNPVLPEVFKLINDRQSEVKNAWLYHVGHLRPGMRKGPPLYVAEEKTQTNDVKVFQLLNPAWPGKRTTWNGFDAVHLDIAGHSAIVVTPKVAAAKGKPWVWHGEFFGHKPAPDIALLEKGFHAVYLSVPDRLGGPEAVARWNDLYAVLTSEYGLSSKPALVGLSRGGLYCYNWASRNPDKVSCIYGDAPVCDFKSWPGGFGTGKGSARDWALVLKQYGFQCDDEAKAYTGNPVDSLKTLAKANVPLLHVFGDADDVVPWDENTGLLAERYQALGGSIELIRKEGVGHHPHGLDDSTPIVDFIVRHAGQ